MKRNQNETKETYMLSAIGVSDLQIAHLPYFLFNLKAFTFFLFYFYFFDAF